MLGDGCWSEGVGDCGGMVFKKIPDPQAVLVNRLDTAGFVETGTTARLDILRVNSTQNPTRKDF